MGGCVVNLPVTSFRYFPFMGAETYVRPLSAYPLALLLIVLFIQFLRDHKRLTWPGAFTPLAVVCPRYFGGDRDRSFIRTAGLARSGLLGPRPSRLGNADHWSGFLCQCGLDESQ